MDELREGAIRSTLVDLAQSSKHRQFVVGDSHVGLGSVSYWDGQVDRISYLVGLDVSLCNGFKFCGRDGGQETLRGY